MYPSTFRALLGHYLFCMDNLWVNSWFYESESNESIIRSRPTAERLVPLKYERKSIVVGHINIKINSFQARGCSNVDENTIIHVYDWL